jgi:hypothetical protein
MADPSTAAYPSPSGELLPWLNSLAEWTRVAQSWSPEDTAAADASDDVCALLREVQSRLRAGSLDALLSWWPAYGRLLHALAVHPLLLLGDAGGLIVASAVRAMRRFSPADAPAPSREACRRYSDWCTQFLRHLSGGLVLPADGTDALFKTLEVGAADSCRAQTEDAVAAAVRAVRARGGGGADGGGGTSRSPAVPACRECVQDALVGEAAPAVDAHAPGQAGDFACRCAHVLARALHETRTPPPDPPPRAGGGAALTAAGGVGGGALGGSAGAASPTGIPDPRASDDWSAVSPLVIVLLSHARDTVSHSLAQAMAEAHARGALRVPASVVADALNLHPRLWAEQLAALLKELHQRWRDSWGLGYLGTLEIALVKK